MSTAQRRLCNWSLGCSNAAVNGSGFCLAHILLGQQRSQEASKAKLDPLAQREARLQAGYAKGQAWRAKADPCRRCNELAAVYPLSSRLRYCLPCWAELLREATPTNLNQERNEQRD
jgi:hypothetical protein